MFSELFINLDQLFGRMQSTTLNELLHLAVKIAVKAFF